MALKELSKGKKLALLIGAAVAVAAPAMYYWNPDTSAPAPIVSAPAPVASSTTLGNNGAILTDRTEGGARYILSRIIDSNPDMSRVDAIYQSSDGSGLLSRVGSKNPGGKIILTDVEDLSGLYKPLSELEKMLGID